MNYNDYRKQEKPNGKRSILFPYREGIFALKSDGYSHLQIRDWLLTENIVITAESIRNFITNQKAQEKTEISSVPHASFEKSPSTPTPSVPPDSATNRPEPAASLPKPGLIDKQKAESNSSKYFPKSDDKLLSKYNISTEIKENK